MKIRFHFIIVLILAASLALTGCAGSKTKKNKKTDNGVEITASSDIDAQTKVNAFLKEEMANDYSFDEPFVTVNPYGNAPLSAVAMFDTDKKTGVQLTVKGHDPTVDITHNFPAAKEHVIPIYGLYPNEENTVILKLDDGKKKVLKIQTESVKTDFSKTEVVQKADLDKMADGLTFVTAAGSAQHGVVSTAYDTNGDLRWALIDDYPAWPVRRLENGRILTSSGPRLQLKVTKANIGFREIDMMGKVYVKYLLPGGNHHDARTLPNGNYLVCTNLEDGDTREDLVVEIDPKTGEIVKTFDLRKVLPMYDGGTLRGSKEDWFHNNSVWYNSEKNSIILSGRYANAIISLDYDTGELQWLIGDPTDWKKLDQKYFFTPIGDNFEWQYAQHAAMYTPEGYVFCFDNGQDRAKESTIGQRLEPDDSYSRGVIFKIYEENMTIEQVWQYGKERGAEWYSHFICDVDLLGKNHYLINSGGNLYDTVKKTHNGLSSKSKDENMQKTTSVVEIKDDEVIFELKIYSNCYRAERITPYVNGVNFDINAIGKVLGTAGGKIIQN